MPVQSGDINQLIQLLIQVGGVDQISDLIQAYQRLDRAQQDLNQSGGRSVAAAKSVEKATYDVGHAYEILDQEIKRATTSTEKDIAATAWMSRQAKELDEVLRDLAKHEREAATAADAMATSAGKAAKTTQQLSEEAQQKLQSQTRGATRAVLELSRAFEDYATGGFIGIVNNIPGAVGGIAAAAGLAAPQVAALEAASAVLATTLYALRSVLPDVSGIVKQAARDFDLLRDPIRDAADDLAGLKEKMQAIEDRPFKLDADYDALRAYAVEVRAAERALREFEALKNKRSPAQQEAFEEVSKGVADAGGAGNLEAALIQVARRAGTYGAGSEIPGQIAQQDRAAAAAGVNVALNQGSLSAPLRMFFEHQRDAALAEAARLRKALDDEQRGKVARMVTLGGGEASRRTLEGIVNDPANADIFQRNQIDTERLGGAIGAADPANIQARERAKVKAQEDQRAQREADNARRQADMLAENERRAQEGRQREANQDEEAKARDAAKMERDADAIRRKNAADAARDQREAPARQRRQAIVGYGQEFQRRARLSGEDVNGEQAETAGKMVAGKVGKGMNVNQAMQATFNEMMRTILEQQAALEQAAGFFGPYTAQLQQLRMRARNVNNNLRRGAQQGPTLGVTF